METLFLVVLVASMLTAFGMSAVLWRSTREDRQHAAARVETLRRLAFSDETSAMFMAAGERGAAKRRAVAVAAVAAGMMSIAGAAFALHDTEPPRSVRPISRSLELLALRHTIGPRGDFVVTGEVRNAIGSGTLFDLAAGVELLDRQGQRVASRQSALPVGVLHGGEASRFTVAFPRSQEVARYQVQFRLADGSLVRHLDRRAARAGDPVERTRHAHAN